MTSIAANSNHHIRPVDSRRDLDAVADIIETCFAEQMDDDGRAYVRHIRHMAQRARGPLPFPAPGDPAPVRGLVWEEDGQVVGNLTLIPFLRNMKTVYLIANVAVRASWRQRGIGSQLTQHAVQRAREMGASAAWLHVRDDNPTAQHIYTRLGFVERSRRATWVYENPRFVHPAPPPQVQVSAPRGADWPPLLNWLQQAYPPEIAWNLPFTPHSISPRPLRALLRWLGGVRLRQAAARQAGSLLGMVTRETAAAHYDWLWLACSPQAEEAALAALLPVVCMPHPTRPLLLNYPAGRAEAALQAQGFTRRNTLIWMEFAF